MSKEALSGLKMLEFSDFISGPYCGKLLADLGAEVIKVENPSSGDKARSWGPFPQDIPHPEKSGLFLYLNTNKLGVTLDVNTVLGAKIFKELVKWADVLIENNPPQKMARLGFDYANLKQLNPGLVVTSITSYGQTGPYRDFKACDLISSHTSGLAYINPHGGVDDMEKQPPLKIPAHAADFKAGLTAAGCTMSAIIAKQATNVGQLVDVSEQEAVAFVALPSIGIYTYEGLPYQRLKEPKSGFTSPYPCKDGSIFLTLNREPFWSAALDMMGNPEWAKDELFRDDVLRRQNMDAIELLVGEWTKEHTTTEVFQAALKRRIPCSPLQTVKESTHSELFANREFFVDIDHKEAGKLKYPGAPYKLSTTPWKVKRPAPLLGEHNEEVYCQRLDYTRQDLVRMRQAGII